MSSNKRKRPTAAAPSSKRNSNLFAKRDDDDDITRFRQNYNNVNSTLQTIPEKKRVLPLISLAIDVAGANPRRCLSGKSNPLDRVADRFHQPILNAVFQHCVVGDDERNLSLPDFIRIFIDRPPGSIDTFDAQVSLSLPVMTAVMSVLAGKDPYPSDGGIASGLQVLSLATSMISEKALQSAIPNLNNLTTLSCEGCAKIKDQALAT
ncbi:hypothetical protein DFS34DRAFT_131324 [Phlyctochytrium arcticum]|nr:hypothetical protein DFS34DRAFT_131324 [Phlyctochytrium arcticum]